MKIKLEIDSNPPEGSTYELKYLDFPLAYSVQAQDLSSLFAGKIHALLCREYVKGRDWYDFIWYISQKTPVNFLFLENVLKQTDHSADRKLKISLDWLIAQLTTKINTINWTQAKQDIARFLKPQELSTLDLWTADFFISRVDKLKAYVGGLAVFDKLIS